jgi:hypothetical protein
MDMSDGCNMQYRDMLNHYMDAKTVIALAASSRDFQQTTDNRKKRELKY